MYQSLKAISVNAIYDSILPCFWDIITLLAYVAASDLYHWSPLWQLKACFILHDYGTEKVSSSWNNLKGTQSAMTRFDKP